MAWSTDPPRAGGRPSRAVEAAEETAAVEERVRELRGVLADALRTPVCGVDLETLKRPPRKAELDLAPEDHEPVPLPRWADFRPEPPGSMSRLFVPSARIARRVAEAEDAFAAAIEAHRRREDERQGRVRRAQRDRSERQRRYDEEAAEQHARVDEFTDALRRRDRRAVRRYFQRSLDLVPERAGFPSGRRVGYSPESALLALDWDVPDLTVVPADASYRYDRTDDTMITIPRPTAERRWLYQQLVAQLALRALHLSFGHDRYGVVDTVVFNGRVESLDLATGRTVRPCLITLRATREQFEALVLDQLDPVACVRDHFGAEVSPHPDELQPVEPVLDIELADPRMITPVDVISEIDRRPNLLDLTPAEFEHLVENLLSRMGLTTQLFRPRGDGGIDCVAYDPAPITGGKIVVQAKLHTKTVPPSAVRDLYGTMSDAGATKGILITTAGFGPASYQFANGKPLQLIDGTGLLALCHRHDIPARIVPRAS